MGTGDVPPTFQGGGHNHVCAPPLLDRTIVLNSLFVHILVVKT